MKLIKMQLRKKGVFISWFLIPHRLSIKEGTFNNDNEYPFTIVVYNFYIICLFYNVFLAQNTII